MCAKTLLNSFSSRNADMAIAFPAGTDPGPGPTLGTSRGRTGEQMVEAYTEAGLENGLPGGSTLCGGLQG